jgi:hypothetical protein
MINDCELHHNLPVIYFTICECSLQYLYGRFAKMEEADYKGTPSKLLREPSECDRINGTSLCAEAALSPLRQIGIMMREPVTTRPAQSRCLIDTHAHLDFEDYDGDRQQVVDRAREAGVVGIITLGIEPPDWQRNIDIAAQFDGVYAALGVHPTSADQATGQSLSDLEQLCRSAGPQTVVALGETGLDYYRHYVSHEEQKRLGGAADAAPPLSLCS